MRSWDDLARGGLLVGGRALRELAALAAGGLAVRVYVAFLGNYTDRGTIGVFSTRQAAEEALRARQEWWDDMVALHWPFLNSGQIGPMRAWYDVEGWHVGGPGEPSRWSDD